MTENLDEWIDGVLAGNDSGVLQNARYELFAQSPIITVRNVVTRGLEAYSSTKADFNLSLGEFVHDFFDEK